MMWQRIPTTRGYVYVANGRAGYRITRHPGDYWQLLTRNPHAVTWSTIGFSRTLRDAKAAAERHDAP